MNYIFAFIFYFKHVISPDFDLFYLLAIVLLSINMIRHKFGLILKSFAYLLPILLLGLFQLYLYSFIDYKEVLYTTTKLFLSFSLMLYCKRHIHSFDIYNIINIISGLFIISIPLSLMCKNEILWRLNDQVNKYSPIRLKLFYTEPSELSFQLAIIMIFIFYFILISRDIRTKLRYIMFFILLSILIYQTKALGGIVYLIISIFIMYLFNVLDSLNLKKVIKLLTFIFGDLILVYLFFTIKNEISLRIIDILNNNDSSVNYRLFVGFDSLQKALRDTYGIGVGVGNLNVIYQMYGIKLISNSLMYSIAEGGIVMLIFNITLIMQIILNNIRYKSILNWGLTIFIIMYQISGGYYTNPMNWIIYGIILNNKKSTCWERYNLRYLSYEKNFIKPQRI